MEPIRTKIIKIGNSQGIRLAKSLIEQYHLNGEVLLEPQERGLVIRPAENSRAGWEEAFQRMRENDDDALVMDEPAIENQFDREEWVCHG